jgi:hypothetical protein
MRRSGVGSADGVGVADGVAPTAGDGDNDGVAAGAAHDASSVSSIHVVEARTAARIGDLQPGTYPIFLSMCNHPITPAFHLSLRGPER